MKDEGGKTSGPRAGRHGVTDAHHRYEQLVERVEAFARDIRQRYPTQVTCHAGCDACCYQQFTIFPVEAWHLAQAVARLRAETRQRLRQRLEEPEDPFRMIAPARPCVLLEDGCCSVYEGRPLICRMQGFPLFSTMITRPDGGQRDCCPLNFTNMALEDIDAPAVYNLDLVNQMLAAIHHLFIQESGQPDQRVSLRQAVLQAFAACAAEADNRP
jgi:Fe-S-cluster containining protein